ncbi:MAG: electron transfer flavoprotein subunit alpha/FixB family protein [Dehalobacterium sp.]
MAGIYIYSDNKNLAAEIVGFSKNAGKEAVVLTFDKETVEAMSNSGADKILLLEGDSALVENNAKAISQILKAEAAELFAVGSTCRGRDIAARVAGYLDCAMVSEIASVSINNNIVTTERMMYGGAVQQTEVFEGLGVITVPSGKFEPVSGTAPVVTINIEADKRVRLIDSACVVREGADLSVAEKVVCVGMGLDKKEDLEMVKSLADAIGAEIGCSRGIAEERHWLPVEQYVGISGANIKPKLYLSLGVSGQIQHVFGVRDSQIIVAIDLNEKAPIFKAADYGIVGSMYEIVPLLIKSLNP